MTRDEQILSLDGLAKKIANRYQDNNNFDDLLQVARMGNVAAVNNFDESRGNKLITFAFPYAQGHVLKYLKRKHSIIHRPPGETKNIPVCNIDDVIFEQGAEDDYETIDLSFLKPRERYVIQRYFYDRFTLKEITEEAGYSQQYWVTVKSKAHKRLKYKYFSQ